MRDNQSEEKSLRIKDNTQKEKVYFKEKIPNLMAKIADKKLSQLEQDGVFVFPPLIKDMEDITEEQTILRTNPKNKDEFCTQNVMGFLGCGDERLIIESRFAEIGNDHFLHYLLIKVLAFPTLVDLRSDADNGAQIFNFLLFLFPYYLKTALRKGLFKKYIHHRYNDENVRGIIDIARHIEKNTPFVGKIAYSQREFSYDNYLMELVRHTIEFIKRKLCGNTLLVRVKDEIKLVVQATPRYEYHDRQKLIEINKKNPVRHAYFREYRALQRLCLLILQHQKHQIGSGPRQIYGILFDGSWLWEEYVNTLIRDIFHHPRNKASEGVQYLFDGRIGKIYPDFISHGINPRIIADAKYKPQENIGIGNKDYLQLLAYMFRFDAQKGYYLYPDNKESGDICLWMNKGSTYEGKVTRRNDICVIKHGLKIPASTGSYKAFAEEMKAREEDFTQALRG
ncbi:MAG: hypothetical protein J1E80_07265 [Desulfovibrionaceae bacterium]|nr:hypothetical protein [Desulfovibrionaceae bacterium]